MAKDTFINFAEALRYYREDSGIKYATVVEMDEAKRTATLRDSAEFHDYTCHVAIWPAKDSGGAEEPERVWGEEY